MTQNDPIERISELDAGWDDPPPSTGVAVSPSSAEDVPTLLASANSASLTASTAPSSQSRAPLSMPPAPTPEEEELDSGWDEPPSLDPAPAKRPIKKMQREPAPLVTPTPSRELSTKKARRLLERQKRNGATSRKAERKTRAKETKRQTKSETRRSAVQPTKEIAATKRKKRPKRQKRIEPSRAAREVSAADPASTYLERSAASQPAERTAPLRVKHHRSWEKPLAFAVIALLTAALIWFISQR